MADGSILTGPDFAFVDDNTYDFVFDTETKLGAGTYDVFDASVYNNRMIIPSSASGEIAEIFMYAEASPSAFSTNDDAYLGPVNATGTGGTQTGYKYQDWYRIIRELGQFSRGYRSGPFTVGADGHHHVIRWRTFGSQHGTMLGARTRMGVLFGDPIPIAAAALRNSNLLPTKNIWTDLTGTEVFDDGGVLNPTTGVFTAPAGSVAAVPCLNFRTNGSFDTDDTRLRLLKNGTEIGRYFHGASGRAPGPGCWGLIEATSGDTFKCQVQDSGLGAPNSQEFHLSVEFY